MAPRRDVVFRTIYRLNRWRGTETRSGPGSTQLSTQRLRRILPELVSGVQATSVLDAACGASFWMPDLPGYIGLDVVPEALQEVSGRFPERTYIWGDIVTSVLPRCDVIIARDVLAHLSNMEVLHAIKNFRRTGATWLCATTFEGADNTRDTRAGGYHEYDLEDKPFALGRPWMVIEDGYWEEHLEYPTKYLGVWALT